jgi:anti-anti-sigma regulatory factor
MPLTIEQVQGRVPVTVIEIHGDLDYSNYHDVIDAAREAYAAGARHLLIDLRDVPFMGSSGLVAIHSAALLMAGQPPPDPEAGWQAHHAMGQTAEGGTQAHVKLLGPQPRVEQVLERTGLKQFFEIHAEQAEAIASF